MGHDLISFGGAFISLTSIHAVVDERINGAVTGNVYIDYGNSGDRIAFEGTAESVMEVINDYCRIGEPLG
jgi:hypothetical protein